jgi:hypothetical protein
MNIEEYLKMLCSDDPEVRITVITYLIQERFAINHPIEFYILMDRFYDSKKMYTCDNIKYSELLGYLLQLREISGSHLLKEIQFLNSKLDEIRTEHMTLVSKLKNFTSNMQYVF